MHIYKIMENFHHEVCFSNMFDLIILTNYMLSKFFDFNREKLTNLSSNLRFNPQKMLFGLP